MTKSWRQRPRNARRIRRFLIRYTHQDAALTWGPFEADDMREAEHVAENVVGELAEWKVEEVKS